MSSRVNIWVQCGCGGTKTIHLHCIVEEEKRLQGAVTSHSRPRKDGYSFQFISCSLETNRRTVFLIFIMRIVLSIVLVLLFKSHGTQGQQNETQWLDRFTYGNTTERADGFLDYGPPDWGDIDCDETNALDECIAYPDKWETGQDWSIQQNYCLWCPDDGTQRCGRHHQSPIDLRREKGFPNSSEYKECIDVHWMKYEDSTCTFQHLVDQDSFTIQRHALRVAQPITILNRTAHTYRLECPKKGVGRLLGRIDFSKGFSQWWYLSHIDFQTPSEHTQGGKRYDMEAKMYHFYSVNKTQAGVANEMSSITIFLQAYDNAAPYRYLDKLICQWRYYEHSVRRECGLDPIPTDYPGCFPTSHLRRNLRQERARRRRIQHQQLETIHDMILYNARRNASWSNVKSNRSTPPTLEMDVPNWRPAEEKDWESWIEKQSLQLQTEEKAYYHAKEKHPTSEMNADQEYRKLIQEDGMEWFNYFLMLGVRTEYYFRYSGSQTIPPCYGNFQSDTRSQTNHYRVLKDPIRIHPRQLAEVKRLLRDRIAPLGDPVASCQADTAADISGDVISVARPLQYEHTVHFEVFCECKDWPSKWPEDRAWCKMDNYTERFYEQPYNFVTDGF